ncbi:MAG TPA: bifunctional 2-polyprenyl-6-hydroxyphenol methylase/3-demethylubiquinol 3-O-methyltransferase UbiG [Stellaceae bacterium]|nr:bifunctional 2-polyprenyl-6-hydroxyphenol methylase/3-demethylubiquinol 3-O-methyltransferase UbiG [Stellaceae bacterium]
MDRDRKTVDPRDVDRFAAQSGGWWDPQGNFRPLHLLNPARLGFIRQQLLTHFGRYDKSLRPFDGLSLADIGCGGGLIAEPMARLGFSITGIDAAAPAIDAARDHAEAVGLPIDYRVCDIDELAETGDTFDVVLALEIIEHVADRAAFFAALGHLVKPGGMFIGATLNRTPRAFALAIIGAEYVLGWLPRGTHDWRQFVRPSEFVLGLRRTSLTATTLRGLAYDWRSASWSETDDVSVNYLLAAVRR